MITIRKVEVKDVLRARDERARLQRNLLDKHGLPLVSFTMNIAGEIKRDEWIDKAFREGVRRIENQLRWHAAAVHETVQTMEFTGCEQIWSVDASPELLKTWMCAIEEADELGRLFDIDVIAADGTKLDRSSQRRCLICGEPVRACARSRAHSATELYNRARHIIQSWLDRETASRIAGCAQRALLYEALAAPKPGLVDRENSGAHGDMDVFSFASSAAVLRSYFEDCARAGMRAGNGENPLEALRFLGRRAEEDMLRVTGGANTHKGAIFSLGILCCAAGMAGENLPADAAKIAAAALREMQDMHAENARTGGEIQYVKLGLTGVRGEAAAGFPSVCEIALPALRKALAEGKSMNHAGLQALLHLMARVDDSNLIRRGGEESLAWAKQYAKRMLDEGYNAEDLRRMDADFIRRNLSPGGCADLLAITYFLYFYYEGE